MVQASYSCGTGCKNIPLWLKITYTAIVCVIVPFYWREYGPENFLWFSDIALLAMVPALWLENRLISSMMAVSVLLLEAVWMLSFLTGGMITDLAAYMFDPSLPLWLRGLSLFHFPMPLVILYVLWKIGYDTRAIYCQSGLLLAVIPLTRLVSEKEDNINWVFRPEWLAGILSAHMYLLLLTLGLIICVYLPSHYLLKRLFGQTSA